MKAKPLSRVRLAVTPWTAAYQAPPSMGFSRQEYWSGVPLPSLNSFLLASYSGHLQIEWDPPALARAASFTQSTNSDFNLVQKYPFRHTETQFTESPLCAKSTCKTNHHSFQSTLTKQVTWPAPATGEGVMRSYVTVLVHLGCCHRMS